MIRDVLFFAGHSMWSSIMLVVLILVFGGILYWTFSGGRHRFDRESRLPLNDEHNSRGESDKQETRL